MTIIGITCALNTSDVEKNLRGMPRLPPTTMDPSSNDYKTPCTRQEKRKSHEEKMAGRGKYNAKHVRLRAESATRSQKPTQRQKQ